jgi:Histidine kinase-, DNA gyrase B-, and HSP90-like ATPase
MRTVQAAPRAGRLIEAMRDVGYSLETAVSDLIDNSIAAKAKNIHVFADPDESAPRFALLDDGTGMTESELLEAMQLGCRDPLDEREAKDLGRFGLGLKTASFSQCRKMTVVTRCAGKTSVARWDLDYVKKTDDWLVQVPKNADAVPWAERLGPTGTLVVWETLDRLLEKDRNNQAQKYFTRRVAETSEHLELIFNRFLLGESGTQRVKMYVNERPLEGFDPFHQKHSATIIGSQEVIRVEGDDVSVQAFTLPHHRRLKKAEWERLGGKDGYVKNQGFYVFREKRLILWGTWFGIVRQTELTKLVRVRIDIPNSLDSKWKLDVKKASAQPPLQVRTRLRNIIDPIVASSKRVYTSKGKKLVEDDRFPIWNRIKDGNQIRYSLNTDNPMMKEFCEGLTGTMRREFTHILDLAGTALPIDALFADLSGQPLDLEGNSASRESLEYFLQSTYQHLLSTGYSPEVVKAMLLATELCQYDAQHAEKCLAKLMKDVKNA